MRQPADKSVLSKVPLKVASLPLKYREKNGMKGILQVYGIQNQQVNLAIGNAEVQIPSSHIQFNSKLLCQEE